MLACVSRRLENEKEKKVYMDKYVNISCMLDQQFDKDEGHVEPPLGRMT